MRPPRSVTAAYPALLCEDARDDRPDLLRARAAGAGARALARARSSQRVDRAGRRHARRPAVPRPAHGAAGEGRVKLRLVGLVSFDPLTGEPRPAIAESWTVTRGGRGLFVKLRDDVRFHGGSLLTADDVAFTLSRLASQEFASASATLLAPIAGYGFVHGDDDTESARARRELIGVGVADRRTVEITLAEP